MICFAGKPLFPFASLSLNGMPQRVRCLDKLRCLRVVIRKTVAKNRSDLVLVDSSQPTVNAFSEEPQAAEIPSKQHKESVYANPSICASNKEADSPGVTKV